MTHKFPLILAALTTTALAGCVENVGDALADPGAFDCRERGAALMSEDLEFVTANPVNFDAFGNRNYNVSAGGSLFRCTIDSDDVIVTFSRI